MNPFDFLKDAAKIKERAQKMQDELDALSAEGSSGGRMVSVTVNGKLEITAIHLDTICVDNRDVKMLEDLIVAAHHDATSKMQELLKEKTGSMLQSIDIPAPL